MGIISKYVEIKVVNRNIKQYSDLGYVCKVGDIISAKIEHISLGSKIKILFECDVCGSKVENILKNYYKSISNGGYYACSRACASEKTNSTNLIKYGNISPLGNKEIQQKSEDKNILKRGVKNPMQDVNLIAENKRKYKEKHGVENAMQRESVRSNFGIVQHPNYIKYINDGISLFSCDKHNHTFEISYDNFTKRYTNNRPLCTICHPISEAVSIKEKLLQGYIKSIYLNNIILNDRKILSRKELDIYLPDLNLAFEFNGLHFHSTERQKDKNYHLNKTIECEKKGIRLIHIFEDNWDYKNDIIKSQINNWLGITPIKIYARKTIVREISTKIAKEFLNDNHIQGDVRSFCKLGLFYNEDLVSVMCFDKLQGRKTLPIGEYNLTRFANKLNHSVIGGASKLMKYFLKLYDTKRLISYADRSWSSGGLYEMLGFSIDKTAKQIPNYKYIVNGQRVHKSNFRKDKLKIDFPQQVADGMTENQIMEQRKIYRIYDCGLIKYEKTL